MEIIPYSVDDWQVCWHCVKYNAIFSESKAALEDLVETVSNKNRSNHITGFDISFDSTI